MAKPRIPNQKKQYQLLNKRLAAYMAAVRRIYGELNSEAARIALSTGYDGKQPFAWKDYPATKARVRKLQEQFVSQLGGLIMTGTSDEWKRSNLQQDLIVDKVLKAYHTSREDAANERYYRDNSEALQAFQQRKEQGMNLSDKLWDQSQAYREELQDTISAAIERGTDAITLSKQISKYLSDFPAMQRDYKEKYGKASKVQNCEYRSIRLARSEINMAYRSAEQQRWRQLDFVVGYEIKMSGSHPVHDVCDELAGKYPKDFVWNGWHPNCMCYEIPILKTEDEFYSEEDKPSVNEVTDVPEEFKDWCTENWQRIETARKHDTLPYFLADNKRYVKENLNIERATELRHANRDADAIRRMWQNRQALLPESFGRGTLYDYEDYLKEIKMGRYFGVDTTELETYVRTAERIDGRKFEELIETVEEKIHQKHHSVAQYRNELQSILRTLKEANGQYQMTDIQDEISAFIFAHPLAGGPGAISYGETMPQPSIFRDFDKRIKKAIVDRSKSLQEKAGLSPKLPSSLYPGSRYLRGEEYVFDKRFFDLISDDVRWDITAGEGVSNWDEVRTCTIYDGDRSEKSPYHRKNVIYHEGGHSIFSKKKLYEQAGFKDLFDYARREIGYEDEFPMYDPISGWGTMRTTRGNHIDNYIERILSRLNTLDERDIEILERHGFNPNDIREALGSCADLLMSIDQRYGFGHRYKLKDGKWYYDHPNMPETEFTAHCFEAKFHGNPFMKKFMPDIYSRILAYVESLL